MGAVGVNVLFWFLLNSDIEIMLLHVLAHGLLKSRGTMSSLPRLCTWQGMGWGPDAPFHPVTPGNAVVCIIACV